MIHLVNGKLKAHRVIVSVSCKNEEIWSKFSEETAMIKCVRWYNY
jgi:hypothetical protein